MEHSFNVYSYYRSVEGAKVFERPKTAVLKIAKSTATQVAACVLEDDEDLAFWIEDETGKKVEDEEIF